MPEESPKPKPSDADVVLLHGPTEDGEGMRVLRARRERLEVGELRPLKEGRAIAGEVVHLTPREGAPNVCDVQVLAKVEPAVRGGPAQVATPAYRNSWERIFGPPAADNVKVLN